MARREGGRLFGRRPARDGDDLHGRQHGAASHVKQHLVVALNSPCGRFNRAAIRSGIPVS